MENLNNDVAEDSLNRSMVGDAGVDKKKYKLLKKALRE